MIRSDHPIRWLATLSILFLIISALPIPLWSEGLTFEKNTKVTNDNFNQAKVEIASWGSGVTAEVYIVYEDYGLGTSQSRIRFQRSVDGGKTYGATYDFLVDPDEPQDQQRYPTIAVYDQGTSRTIAVFYIDSTYRSLPGLAEYVIVCKISTDGGATWGADKLVTPTTEAGYPSSNIRDLDSAFDPNGNLFVAWEESNRIKISYSTDIGTTWSPPQKAYEDPSPEPEYNPNYMQKKPTIAGNGAFVGIAYESDINSQWKKTIYFARSATSSLSGGTLTFQDEYNIPLMVYPLPLKYSPRMVADSTSFNIVWWDFVTSYKDQDYQDPSKDRPSIMFSRSTDNGASFEIGTARSKIVNTTSSPTRWHSAADIAIAPNMIAVSWIDYTIGNKPNIFVSTSTDNGVTWSTQDKVNDFSPNSEKEIPRIAFDQSKNVHVAWLDLADALSYNEVYTSRSIINQAPIPVAGLTLADYDESYANVFWTINTEPDFKMYKTYISKTPGFAISDIKWPVGPLYTNYTNQATNLQLFEGLSANTRYYVKVGVVDQGGLVGESNELSFGTLPTNEPPVWHRDVPTIYLQEDESLNHALNFSYWRQIGWITDDNYTGNSELRFGFEDRMVAPNVTANVESEGIPAYWYLNLYTSKANWAGPVPFVLYAEDAGKDGGFETDQDNKKGYSNLFYVIVNSTNDLPTWKRFYDITGQADWVMQSTGTEFRVPADVSGCIEGLLYEFAIVCNDIDDDNFIRYTTSDPRIVVKEDTLNPDIKSKFSFTPTNDDVPELNITVTADDKEGGMRNLTLYIPVANVNDAPFFLTANGQSVPETGGIIHLETNERNETGFPGHISFYVTAGDIDPIDSLTLKSSDPKRLKVTKNSFGNWTVEFTVADGDAGKFLTYQLQLMDIAKIDLVTMMVNISVVNAQDPPTWIAGRTRAEWTFIYDLTDFNEWGEVAGGDAILAEWGETIRFEAFATDSDNDVLNYTWTIFNLNHSVEWKVYGKRIDFEFYPVGSTLWDPVREKFVINLTVTDNNFPGIWYQFEMWLESDDDNDNDGLCDKREMFFYDRLEAAVDEENRYYPYRNLLTAEVIANPLLLFKPDEDLDLDLSRAQGDTYNNINEIGFEVPRRPEEKTSPYSVNDDFINPLDPQVWPGHTIPPDDDDDVEDDDGPPIETWMIVAIIAVIFVLLVIILGVIVVLRMNKKKEIEEEEDIEKRVAAMDRRQKELEGLYGVQKAGDGIGPDQSTLSDLKIDLGGQIYHEEGSGALVKEKKGAPGVSSKSEGPKWEKGSGPVFEESAPKLLGESVSLEDMHIDENTTVLDHQDIDEEAVDSSFEEILDAAEDYDEEAMKDAGGKVMVGAMPMEEQMKRMQGQTGTVQGPRVPPPGMENQPPAPTQGMPPGQMHPQMMRGPAPGPAPAQYQRPPQKPVN